jgi:molecular chaperone GrpE (heat shock protein)
MEDLRDDVQSRLDNMPESLQESPSGTLLQERIEALDTVISNLEDLNTDFDCETEDPGEEPQEPERPEVPAKESVDDTRAQGIATCQKELEECRKRHEQWKSEHSEWEEKQEAQEAEFIEWREQLESEVTDALDFSCS